MSGPTLKAQTVAQASEAERLALQARYARRAKDDVRYSLLNPVALRACQERQRATLGLLADQGLLGLGESRVLEVGCGTGGNLLDWLRWGVDPCHLVGIELLAERHQLARERLPTAVSLILGDACEILETQAQTAGSAPYDIVMQTTVFSSLLDDLVQQRMADAMWRVLKPGGLVIWYDFTVDNPRNPDVRGVPLQRVKALFPAARVSVRRLTLAPPLARAVGRWPSLHAALNLVPFLRTHVLVGLSKPQVDPASLDCPN